jgi:hypothetical protein
MELGFRPLLTAITGCRDELAQRESGIMILKKTQEIPSVLIEHVESDTVWDIMTIVCSGRKVVIDITGPVAWHVFGLLSSVLGEKVSYEED